MALTVGELIVKLTGDAGGLDRELKVSGDQLVKFGAISTAVGTLVARMGERALEAGLNLIKFPIDAAREAGRYAEQLDHLSQRTGVAVQTLENWSVILAETGIETHELAMGIKGLAVNIQEAQSPTSQAAQAFERLGLSLLDIQGVETEQVLRLIADRVKLLPDGLEKSAIMTNLLGRAGESLIPIMNKGAQAFDESARQAERLGATMTTLQRTTLKDMDDAFDRLGVAVLGFGRQVGAAFAPSIKWVAELATSMTALATQVFTGLLDAATKLTARIVGMARVTAELGATIFSTNVFSLEAWRLTLDRIGAIDRETAAIIAGVDAERKAQEAKKNTLDTMKEMLPLQRQLGESIRDTTIIMVKLREEQEKLGFEKMLAILEVFAEIRRQARKSQEVIGAGIVDTTKIQVEATKQQLSDNAEVAASSLALAEARQANEFTLFRNTDLLRKLAMDKIDADMQARLADEDLSAQQITAIQQSAMAQRIAVARQFPTFWEEQLQNLKASSVQTWSAITMQFSSAIASWIQGTATWAQTFQAILNTILQAVVNLVVDMTARWVLSLLVKRGTDNAMLESHTQTELAKTAVTAAQETARLGLVKGTNLLIAAAMLTSLGALETMGIAALAVMTATSEAVIAIMYAMAAALAVVGIFIPPLEELAGALIVAATELQIGTAAAVIAAGTAISGAVSVAAGSLGGLAGITSAPGLQAGGTVAATGLAVVHEGEMFWTPGQMGGPGPLGQQTITIELDGRVLTQVVIRNMPSEVRFATGVAL